MIRAFVAGSACALATACGRFDFDPLADVLASDASCGHTFCDHFQRTTPQGEWDSALETNGMLAIHDGQLAAAETVTMPNTAQVRLAKLVGVASSHIRLETDYAFDTGGDGEIDLVRLQWQTRPATCTSFGFFIVRDRQTNSVALQETYGNCGGTGNITTPFAGVASTGPSGTHHITIDVTTGDIGTGRVDATIDAAPVSRTGLPYPIPASMIALEVGLDNVQINTTTWSVRFDNVIVDLN